MQNKIINIKQIHMIKIIFNTLNIQNRTINKINIQNIQKNIQINIKLITYMFKIKLNKITLNKILNKIIMNQII